MRSLGVAAPVSRALAVAVVAVAVLVAAIAAALTPVLHAEAPLVLFIVPAALAGHPAGCGPACWPQASALPPASFCSIQPVTAGSNQLRTPWCASCSRGGGGAAQRIQRGAAPVPHGHPPGSGARTGGRGIPPGRRGSFARRADGIGRGATEHPLRRRIEDHDALRGVGADDGVHGRFDDAAQTILAGPEGCLGRPCVLRFLAGGRAGPVQRLVQCAEQRPRHREEHEAHQVRS